MSREELKEFLWPRLGFEFRSDVLFFSAIVIAFFFSCYFLLVSPAKQMSVVVFLNCHKRCGFYRCCSYFITKTEQCVMMLVLNCKCHSFLFSIYIRRLWFPGIQCDVLNISRSSHFSDILWAVSSRCFGFLIYRQLNLINKVICHLINQPHIHPLFSWRTSVDIYVFNKEGICNGK